jgi:hypothetical protein
MDENDRNGADPAGEGPVHAGRRPARRRRWPLLLVAGLVAAGVFLAVLPLEVYRDWALVCENTGARRGYRQWCIGWRSGEWYRESDLERFMGQQHPSVLTYRRTSYSGTGRNLFGWAMRHGHEHPNGIVIVMDDLVFDRYVKSLDNTAKRGLYDLLASDRQTEIEAQRVKMWNKALELQWDRK